MSEETLFLQALSRPVEERAAFLAQACAGQPELRAAVEALLAAHEKSANILDQPPADLSTTVDSDPGKPRGPATPFQLDTTYCGNPLSLTVGMSLSNGSRSSPAVARIRSLPSDNAPPKPA